MNKPKHPACLMVRIEHPSGSDAPRINVELAERRGDRGEDRAEYPSTPDNVNGMLCEHGELGLYSWIFDGKLTSHSGPEYRRVSYVDAYKCEQMGKTMSTLKRRLEKMREARGPVMTWTDCVLRFAEACGVKSIAFTKDIIERIDTHNERERPRDMYGEHWYFVSPGDAAYLLRDLEASFAPKAPKSIDDGLAEVITHEEQARKADRQNGIGSSPEV